MNDDDDVYNDNDYNNDGNYNDCNFSNISLYHTSSLSFNQSMHPYPHQEFNELCSLLTVERLDTHPEYRSWSVAKGRQVDGGQVGRSSSSS